MLRKSVALLIAAILLVGTLTGGAVAAGPTPTKLVAVAGTLEYVADVAPPHYEVNDYVLLLATGRDLATMVGTSVMVVGTEVAGPSIYMKKTLEVQTIGPNDGSSSTPAGSGDVSVQPALPAPSAGSGHKVTVPVAPSPIPASGNSNQKVTIPVIADPIPASGRGTNQTVTIPVISDPVPAGGNGDRQVTIPVISFPDPSTGASDPRVTIPVITQPLPGLNTPVSVPTPPSPFFGTPFYVLFGRLELVQGAYYLVDPADSHIRYLLTGEVSGLSALVGQTVGVVAARETVAEGLYRYQVLGVVVLSRDLAELINVGSGLIFQLPSGRIAVRLHGKPIQLDPAPIIGNGRTLVGVRTITEAMGATVRWDDGTKTATIALGDREVVVTLGSNRVVIHQKGMPDKVVISDVACVIVNGRMMIPLRVLSEGLGLTVNWDAANRIIDLD